MTDEEKRIFEEWFEEKKDKCEVYGNGDDFWVDDEIKKFCLMGYELGLKAGRPQWHDLRKDPNDLPEDGRIVSDQEGNNVRYVERLNKWFYRHRTCKANVIAWCEIPTFDKE
jgi:hypothetical protein